MEDNLGSLNNIKVGKIEEKYKNWIPPEWRSKQLLTEEETHFLNTVVEHQDKPSGKVAEIAGVSTQRAAKIRRRLVSLKYIVEREVQLGHGRPSKLLVPSDKALDFLQRQNQ